MNEVPIYMKVAPNIDWSGVFYLFCCWDALQCPTVSRGLQCHAPISLAQELPPNFKLAKFQTSGCMTGVRTKLKWLLRFLLIRASGESKLMGQPEPDSPDVQSPPHESDFIRCQRVFHLPLSHLSHNCIFPCHLWIMDGRRKQTYSADSSLL